MVALAPPKVGTPTPHNNTSKMKITISKSALDEEYDYWVEASADDADVDMTAIEADYNKVLEVATWDKENDLLSFTIDDLKKLLNNHFLDFIYEHENDW